MKFPPSEGFPSLIIPNNNYTTEHLYAILQAGQDTLVVGALREGLQCLSCQRQASKNLLGNILMTPCLKVQADLNNANARSSQYQFEVTL